MLAFALSACQQPSTRVTRVMVVSSGGSNADVEDIRSAIVDRDNLVLEDVSRLASVASERDADREDLEARAQPHLERSSEAFSRFDYAAATSELNEALSVMRPSARDPQGRRRLAELHMRLALVLLVHEERDAALEEIRTCLHLSAACAPDPALHPPELVALHAEAQSTAGTGAIRIETDPAGASVSISGSDALITPAEWNELPTGRHYVTIERDGFRPAVEIVPVTPGGSATRTVSLTLGDEGVRAAAALRALQTDGSDTDPRWRVEALALGEADALLVVGNEGPRAFDGRGETIEVEGERLGERFVDAAFPRREARFYEKWWFWTPISLAVAVALSAVVFALVRTPEVQLVGGDTVRE